jgi:hypothetical protein
MAPGLGTVSGAPVEPPGIQVDPESGTRYVLDPTVPAGKVPRAELATEADKAAFLPSDVTLPERTVEGEAPPGHIDLAPLVRRATLIDPDPDRQYFDPILNESVKRGELVSVPPGTAPKAVGRAAPVTYPPIAEDQGAPGTPPKVLPAQPVTGPQPTEPEAPGKPAVTTATQPAAASVPGDWRTWTTIDGTPAEPQVVQPKAEADISGQDNTGIADYFRKRGDKPITDENDPRLTVVGVGDRNGIHQKFAPYFQGFLQELVDQGANVLRRWLNYRQKVAKVSPNIHGLELSTLIRWARGGHTWFKWLQEHPDALQAAEQAGISTAVNGAS